MLCACLHGHHGVVSELVGRGAQVDKTNKDFVKALLLAMHESDLRMLELLLIAGADIELRDDVRAFKKIQSSNRADFGYRADFGNEQEDKLTALHFAAIHWDQATVDQAVGLLVAHGAQVDAPNDVCPLFSFLTFFA